MSRTVARFPALAAALLASIALAACTADAPQPSPAKSVAAPPAADPGTAQTPEPAGALGPRFGASCAELLDPAAAGFPGTSAPTGDSAPDAAEFYGPGDQSVASRRQSGVLHCVWGNGTDEPQYGPTAVLSVIADRSADAQAEIGSWLSLGATDLGLGDRSAGRCLPELFQCSAEVELGGTWFYVQLLDQGSDSPLGGARGQAVLQAAAKQIATALASRQPRPAWAAPASGWDVAAGCGDLGGAALDSRIGAGGFLAGPELEGDDGPLRIALRTDRLDCAWTAASKRADGTGPDFSLGVVAGAGWVWPSLGGASGVTSTEVAVEGADRAAFRCSGDAVKTCWADAIADGAWVQLAFRNPADATQDDTVRALTAVLAGHAAS